MKAVQTWVGLAVLIVVIFGVTLLSQSLSSLQSTDKPGGGIADGPVVPKLTFPVTAVDENTVSEITPVKGTRDFWFENANLVPLEIAIEKMSCKCSKVELLTLKTEEEPAFAKWQNQRELLALTASRGLLPTLVAAAATDTLVRGSVGSPQRWQSLMYEGKRPVYFPVPPQCKGLVRLTWEGKQPGAQRLKATLVTRQPDEAKTEAGVVLEMPVRFVDVLHVDRPTVDIDELPPGTHRTALFPVFSPTRAGVHFEAREKTGDPCVKCQVVPMSEPQRAFLQQSRTGETANMPVLAGYVVAVTISERAGDKQFDLGPFQREVVLTSEDTPETHHLTVKGVVLGEVRILGEDQKHRINLGQFDALGGTAVDLTLESDRPAIKLEADSRYPAYLRVDLKEAGLSPAGGRQWNLHVQVPAGQAFGRLPADSAVVLKTLDSPPRRLRIPVTGHGTMR